MPSSHATTICLAPREQAVHLLNCVHSLAKTCEVNTRNIGAMIAISFHFSLEHCCRSLSSAFSLTLTLYPYLSLSLLLSLFVSPYWSASLSLSPSRYPYPSPMSCSLSVSLSVRHPLAMSLSVRFAVLSTLSLLYSIALPRPLPLVLSLPFLCVYPSHGPSNCRPLTVPRPLVSKGQH